MDTKIAWGQAFPGVKLPVQLRRLEIYLANRRVVVTGVTHRWQDMNVAKVIDAWLARSMQPRPARSRRRSDEAWMGRHRQHDGEEESER